MYSNRSLFTYAFLQPKVPRLAAPVQGGNGDTPFGCPHFPTKRIRPHAMEEGDSPFGFPLFRLPGLNRDANHSLTTVPLKGSPEENARHVRISAGVEDPPQAEAKRSPPLADRKFVRVPSFPTCPQFTDPSGLCYHAGARRPTLDSTPWTSTFAQLQLQSWRSRTRPGSCPAISVRWRHGAVAAGRMRTR